MLVAKLGYRNLWRNRRRSLLTMSAMAVATAMVILMLGIYDGMLWDMIDTATEMYYGHIRVTAEGYLDRHEVHVTLEQDGLRRKLLDYPRVDGVAGRVRGFALLSCGRGEESRTNAGELFGVMPGEERTVTKLHEQVTAGSYLSGADTMEMVMGAGLARRLEAEIGDEIVVMGQAADGSMIAELFTVAGIVETGNDMRDASLAIVGRTTLQRLMVLDGEMHEWAVHLNRVLASRELARIMGDDIDGVDVLSWHEFLPQLGQLLDLWDVMKYIFSGIFYFAVILVTMNTMYMAFFERMREFGIMGAIGLRLRRLAMMIMVEGLFMSGIAGCVGGAVGILMSFYLKEHHIDLSAFLGQISYAGSVLQPRLRTYPAFDNMIIPILMVIALGVLVSVFPAMRIRKLKPVDVLKEV